MKREELTQEIVRELLHYDPDTGILKWKERDVKWFNETEGRSAEHSCTLWNARYSNKRCFNRLTKQGYRSGLILSISCLSHRIIFLILFGRFPEQVDHINGNRQDNRLENLREVNNSENHKNRKTKKISVSGILGVCKRYNGKFQVYINEKENRIYLGTYETLEEASEVRKEANLKYGYHENHGRK